MRHLERLHDALRDRYRRLAQCDPSAIDHEVARTRDWINNQPLLRAILLEVDGVEPGLDYEAWRTSLYARNDYKWPARTEAGEAALVWRLMNDIAEADSASTEATTHVLGYSMRYQVKGGDTITMVRKFLEEFFGRLFTYISDHVTIGSAVLYVLQRYVARVEWYDRDELYRRYQDAVTARRVGEEVYNLDLQRFLFLDGGHITQAKARSASGEADLIGGLDTDDPLICEGKLFDGASRGKSYLARGFHQVIQYANDYNKTVAHLVVFNLTERLLQFQTDGPTGAWAPYVENAGVRVHLIVVRAYPPDTTASKSGKATTVSVSREDLITLDDETDHDAPGHETPTGAGS